MTTKTKARSKTSRPRKPAKARARKSDANGQPPAEMDGDRLSDAKRWRSHGESARLQFEEAKADHAKAKAEYNIAVAKRNLLIATSTDIKDVQDAQKEVHNAHLRKAKKKSLLDSAKDELKGSEEHLAKAMTESFPLFGEGKAAAANGAAD